MSLSPFSIDSRILWFFVTANIFFQETGYLGRKGLYYLFQVPTTISVNITNLLINSKVIRNLYFQCVYLTIKNKVSFTRITGGTVHQAMSNLIHLACQQVRKNKSIIECSQKSIGIKSIFCNCFVERRIDFTSDGDINGQGVK